jgi:hypothetical protein
MNSLCDRDALAWSAHQASLLRRRRARLAGERSGLEHVIEEIKDVGLSQLHSDHSYLHQMLVHLLKVHDWPDSLSAGHWRGEFVACQEDAARRFAPPMRQRIDLTRHTVTQSINWRSPVTKRARLALGPRSARSP